MTIRLEVTGENPQAFLQNALGVLVMLAQGAQTLQEQQQAVQESPPPPFVPEESSRRYETPAVDNNKDAAAEYVERQIAAAAPKRGPGRPKKNPAPAEAVIPQSVVQVHGDDASGELFPMPSSDPGPLPGFLERNAPPDKEISIDDLRMRVRDINTEHTKRLAAAGKEPDDIMGECVDYIRSLFNEFGVRGVGALAKDQHAPFMARSQAYLEGQAEA